MRAEPWMNRDERTEEQRQRDNLGARLAADLRRIDQLREVADHYDRKAQQMRREADEVERLMELARLNA